MDWKGKVISVLGDSITEGACATEYNRCFVFLLGKELGLSRIFNNGISGTRIARQAAPSEEPRFDLDYCQRLEEVDRASDAVLVFGGTNDYGHGDAPLGQPGDTTVYTFYGALDTLCRGLKKDYSQSKVVFFTPLRRANDDQVVRPGGERLEKYAQAIRELAGNYGYPVLDLYRESSLKFNEPETAAKWSEDGLHPNDPGHAILAKEIAAFLKAL